MITSLPVSRVPDPSIAPPLRWGVLGPGTIARAFVGTLQKHSRQQVVAVGSRSRERGEQFAREFGIERVHPTYEALVADPGVDVIYVATPHSHHHDQALLAIEAGKHVLVEKAFTRNAAEAREVVAAAQGAGVVALEAMWSRFLPGTDVLRQLLADGALGEIVSVAADHGQVIGPDDARRLHDPALAGGALLDLGIYPLSFASLVLGAPDAVSATGRLTPTGVDEQIRAVLRRGDAEAVLTTTLASRTPTTAEVVGTAARVALPGDFYTPVPLRVTTPDGRTVLTADPGPIHGHEGLVYQAGHLAQLVADGTADSPVLPADETIGILTTADEIRRQVGVTYPGEEDHHVQDEGPFFHGTKADLRAGDELAAGFRSNYRPEVVMNHIYFTAQVSGAGLAAELAAGDREPRVYAVEPTGPFENDPNVTDKKFPGNPTRSYRSRAPLRILHEVTDWPRLSPEALQQWRDRLAAIRADDRPEIIN